MNEVRTIIRRLASELETVKKMLEIAGMRLRLIISWTKLADPGY